LLAADWSESPVDRGATDADTLAREFGEHKGIPVRTFPADWERHGRAAGPIRNRQMLEEGKPDLVVAFLDGRARRTGEASPKSWGEGLRTKDGRLTPLCALPVSNGHEGGANVG
jgi:hypothetical protein